MKFDTLIIGAGAAGSMAAITAARRGKKVAVVEKNGRVGKKLRITGKGRCNVTNCCDIDEFMNNIPVNNRFMYSSFSAFSAYDVMQFFEDAGVPLKVERGNRVFPVSDSAADIVLSLDKMMKDSGVKFIKDNVTGLIIEDNMCKGLVAEHGKYYSETVLVATGGVSYPLTGSTGDGYKFAEDTGHVITDIVPSLVPLEINGTVCSELSGLALRNVTLTLYDRGKAVYSELGEMTFTDFGVTGPLVLTASSRIRKMEAGRYKISVDLKPGLNEEKLDKRLQRDFSENSQEQFINVLVKLLPSKIIPSVIKLSGISASERAGQITRKQRTEFVKILKNFTLEIKNFRPISEAIVTSGGVSVKDVDPKTMQSRHIKGLFFAGEVLDVDGYTGGFNLQIAFSTGYAAGINL